MHKHHSALGLATTLRPVQPVTLIRPHAARRAARFFVEKFPGRSLYAVKANPSPELLQVLWESGITHYDVASIAEVRLVARTLPEATLCFMHPVKAEEAIAEAYFTHGVRDLLARHASRSWRRSSRATRAATDLTLCVRLRVSSEHSKLASPPSSASTPAEATELLLAARQAADALGICFHVGSQAMTPEGLCQAMERVRAAIVEAASRSTSSMSAAASPRSIRAWSRRRSKTISSAIHRAFESLPVSYSAELWCEPGRALCAEYSSLIVRVERRRGDELYINDGAYGALFDAAHVNWRFPVQAAPRGREPRRATWRSASTARPATISTTWRARSCCRTTCGPATISRSACSAPMAARCAPRFNGFGRDQTVIVEDEPMASLYHQALPEVASNVVTL